MEQENRESLIVPDLVCEDCPNQNLSRMLNIVSVSRSEAVTQALSIASSMLLSTECVGRQIHWVERKRKSSGNRVSTKPVWACGNQSASYAGRVLNAAIDYEKQNKK